MSLVPTNCTDFDLVETKNDVCELEVREVNIKSIGFYKASTILPNPLTEAAITELIAPTDPQTTKPGLVFSNELANVTLGEPQISERKLSDSRPPMEFIESREVDFEDRIAVNLTQEAKVVFQDYQFWKDKRDHSTVLNVVFALSDGRLIVPRAKNSNGGMPQTFNVFLNYEAQTQGGAVEFKKGKVKFLGDPFDFVQPDINLFEIPAIQGKW